MLSLANFILIFSHTKRAKILPRHWWILGGLLVNYIERQQHHAYAVTQSWSAWSIWCMGPSCSFNVSKFFVLYPYCQSGNLWYLTQAFLIGSTPPSTSAKPSSPVTATRFSSLVTPRWWLGLEKSILWAIYFSFCMETPRRHLQLKLRLLLQL